MTNEELKAILRGKSEQWREGFFFAVNLNSDMKAAFLTNMIGEPVEVAFKDDPAG